MIGKKKSIFEFIRYLNILWVTIYYGGPQHETTGGHPTRLKRSFYIDNHNNNTTKNVHVYQCTYQLSRLLLDKITGKNGF